MSESTEPLFTNEPDCVILRGQLALDVIHGVPWLDPEYGTPGYAEFLVDFEMDGNDSLEAESNPNGADFGLDEGDYVFRPVAPATIPTFSFEVA